MLVSESEKWLNILVSSVTGRHTQELDLDLKNSSISKNILIDRNVIGNESVLLCHFTEMLSFLWWPVVKKEKIRFTSDRGGRECEA